MFWPIIFLPLLFLLQQQEQQKQALLRAEEEERTPYTEDDLMQDWEFKIVRSANAATHPFLRRELLSKLLAEEAQAGWQLVELFDGNRIRLKRPVSCRAQDASLPPDCDPYRLILRDPHAASRVIVILLWVFCVLAGIAAVLCTVASLVNQPADRPGAVIALAISGGLTVLFGVLAWLVQRRMAS
jgi:hypothetical protein